MRAALGAWLIWWALVAGVALAPFVLVYEFFHELGSVLGPIPAQFAGWSGLAVTVWFGVRWWLRRRASASTRLERLGLRLSTGGLAFVAAYLLARRPN